MCSCIKKIAISEPLVDTVNPDQICTKACQLKTIDIHTCTKADLTFVVPWKLVSCPPYPHTYSSPFHAPLGPPPFSFSSEARYDT
jgi:protein arginine N-methyltransferase 1